MKILFVCHRFPYPPKRGGKIRPFNIISHLSKSHEVTVASLARSKKEAREGSGLKDYCFRCHVAVVTPFVAMVNMLRSFLTGKPVSMGYFYSSKLRWQIFNEMANRSYDFIFVHCSSVAQYVEDIHGFPKIMDFGDMDSQKWHIYSQFKKFPMSLIYWFEGRRLEREERKIAGKFNIATCTTRNEKETLDSYGTGVTTDWFPNGVDHDYFSPDGTDYIPNSLCFIGRMDYYPNQEGIIEFCNQVLPLIKEKCPQVTLTIVGADPAPAIRRLERIAGVKVTGSVADVRPYVLKAAVNVVPLNIARGTQNKILESLAMGVPTVTSVQAADGVDAVNGEHFLVASGKKQFADAVLRLLSDHEERMKFSRAGRERMLSHHNWSKSMEKLDNIIANCLGESGLDKK